MSRVLGRIRLSRLTDESTSAARQRELIEQWATMQEHTIVGWAEDLDVSGSVDPFDTPQLGAWLNHRADEFDVIAAWKLDRIGRSAARLNNLIGWCMQHDKTLVSCTEGIDISTPVGRLIANVIGFLAEGELDAIRERTKASRKKLRELGRHTGKAPYGLRAVPLPEGGFTLEHNPETKPVLDGIIAQVLAGRSVESIAAELDCPSPGGKPVWKAQTIRKLLRSETLLGHTTHGGVAVRDSEGQPILKSPPLTDLGTFNRIQDALEGRSFTKSRTDKTSPLLGLVKCMKCESNFHHRGQTTRTHLKNCVPKGPAAECGCPAGKLYRYYYCRSCKGKQTKALFLEKLFEKTYLKQYGDKPREERAFIPASDNQTALEAAVAAVEELSALMGETTSPTVRKTLTEQLRGLTAQIERLEAEPSHPARYEMRPTGRTHAEAWEAADPDERRQLLFKSGIVGHAAWSNEGKLALVLTQS